MVSSNHILYPQDDDHQGGQGGEEGLSGEGGLIPVHQGGLKGAPDHCVVIKYVPYVGDSKRAMDEYTSEIFMGGKVRGGSTLAA